MQTLPICPGEASRSSGKYWRMWLVRAISELHSAAPEMAKGSPNILVQMKAQLGDK